MTKLQPKWGWFVALGALTAFLGLITLLYLVVFGTIASIYMIGFAIIVAGIAEVTVGAKARRGGWRAIWILAGALYVATGLIAIIQPLLAAAVLTLMLGVAFLVIGAMRVVAAFQLPAGGRAMVGLAGAISVLLGVLILVSWPNSGLVVLGAFLGTDLLLYGVSWVGFGLRLKAL